MKRIVIYSLSVLLVAGVAISCKKTSKGKMSNDWNLSEFSSTETETDNDGDVYTETITSDGTSITRTTSNTSNGSTSSNTVQGVVNDYSYVINKDGTWEETMDVTFTSTNSGTTTTENSVMTSSGTWNFLGKIEEFKKNERVVFNTLSETMSNTTSTTFGGSTLTSSSSETESFANGENSEVMLVVESKRKELQLKTERDYTSQEVQGNSTYTYSVTAETEWSLVQE